MAILPKKDNSNVCRFFNTDMQGNLQKNDHN